MKMQIRIYSDIEKYGGKEYRLGDLYYGYFKYVNAKRAPATPQ